MQSHIKLLLLVTGGLGCALSFLAGRATAPDSSHDELLRLLERQGAQLEALEARLGPASQQTRCAVAAPGGAPGLDTAWLQAELARILHEELGSQRAEAKGAQTPVPEPSTESLTALQEGHRLLDEASRSQRWREEDAQAMHRAMRELNGVQREELMRRFAVFVNAGGVDVQVKGPPF
ncbi:hypothetical protein [Vitiosangium sp. GDMCC 1.1324]|uniref:hypothetical protein n=1 Tax=Vitiosangium sp. (strain GDMCC 1.1324) TaxID=2138576 RepID=UPI000D36FC32|nr:hypothetical protein [Vitiosangium sp. GDMCC 1.1324]PTL75514.1 hypothetical protein DAT35_54640 [Vitiosangium sp. GDMCC 1.1324]